VPRPVVGDLGAAGVRLGLVGPDREALEPAERTAGARLALFAACSGPARDDGAEWRELTRFTERLPAGVDVRFLEDTRFPLRAWCVRVPEQALGWRVVVSDEPDGTETPSSLAAELGACVVVNAGFFDMDAKPARASGLLLCAGELLHPPQRRRPALGIDAAGRTDLAWVSLEEGELVRWSLDSLDEGSPPKAPRGPGSRPSPWPMRDAVAGNVPLAFCGVAYDNPIEERHPRTAVGRTAQGELVVVVVDGRQDASRGLSLDELAELMLELGCESALNLDGGGSSALVVLGERLNRPVGGELEREVHSALALFCD